MPNPADQTEQLFKAWVEKQKVLVADANAASRAGLARVMSNLGAKTANQCTSGYDEATEQIGAQKPTVIICDYDLGPKCGLDLLQTQRKAHPESRKCLFVLVTGNTSQSAVAQAAEEDVDTYVLKPYTLGVLRNSIMKAALAKVNPTDYTKKIEEGKVQLEAGKFDEALKIFGEAKGMDPKPALACFYLGQAGLLKQLMDPAQDNFKEGLNFNKIHYKCMVGLFELLQKKKDHIEAYEIIKRVSRYFPANPERLAAVLRLAIMTGNYDDIERYYQAFTSIDTRNEELIKYICAALVVCGKFYLQQSHTSRAMELFTKAAVTAGGGRTKFLREIILALLANNMLKDAQSYLLRFDPATHGGAEYLTMDYLIADRTLPPSAVVQKGRDLIAKGIHDPQIYLILVARSMTQASAMPRIHSYRKASNASQSKE